MTADEIRNPCIVAGSHVRVTAGQLQGATGIVHSIVLYPKEHTGPSAAVVNVVIDSGDKPAAGPLGFSNRQLELIS